MREEAVRGGSLTLKHTHVVVSGLLDMSPKTTERSFKRITTFYTFLDRKYKNFNRCHHIKTLIFLYNKLLDKLCLSMQTGLFNEVFTNSHLCQEMHILEVFFP